MKGGEKEPEKHISFDVVCNSPTVHGSSYFRNSQLSNFKQTYDDLKCQQNYAVKTNPAADSFLCGTYLTGVTCDNCDLHSLFKFDNPNPGWIGWFGGCGDVLTCTGLKNFVFSDLTGSFFGKEVPT